MDQLVMRQLSDLFKYQFNDVSLLELALSHRSYQHNNNERLEFLGDSILNFTIAESLYQKFKTLPEGDLSRLRASLVKSESLAEVAKSIKLGDFILLGEGELKSAGWRRPSILADTFEAIIGAIYLDGGFEEARKFILKFFQTQIESIDPKRIVKDAKTTLQELLQSRKLMIPEYKVIKIEGEAHNQVFFVQCEISQLRLQTEGSGTSRKLAEQEAAMVAIEEVKQKI
jgi:ribonuclease-3